MKTSFWKENKRWIFLMTIIMMLQLVVASYFCVQKQGFHYDEYYSYYSSNVTHGLAPTDREWKDVSEIRSEFRVLEGERFRYDMVKIMQSYDVHPPLYYMILHTVCSLFPGLFSKWLGLGINLLFFIICYWLLAYIAYHVFRKNKYMTAVVCLLFGFQVGVLSGITFIRMYMMLTMWCLGIVVWHIPTWKQGIKLSALNSILLFLLVMAGFLTHYYYAVFLFFLAAYTCLYNWWGRKDFKGSFLYGCVVCLGMVAAVIYYPSCLSHIFRGYRGTEAVGAFFDIQNTVFRINFFTELMNESVFGGALWLFLLIVVILLLAVFVRKKGKSMWKKLLQEHQGMIQIAFTTEGYFLVVAKTALLNAEEANRYELPIYGFCMLVMVAVIYYLVTYLMKEVMKIGKEEGAQRKIVKFTTGLGSGLVVLALTFQIFALTQGKVQFLYPEDLGNVQWAAEHKDSVIVYLYNPNNVWMIWDESEELMQYENIYFVSLANETPLEDGILLEAKDIYVYTSRMEQAETIMEDLIEKNPDLDTKEKIRELLYCDLYYMH